ncbi:MAG: DUF5011 domain-containing protein [Bacteroidales bacterium]|jgi:hypothetical protein|nr:DUF5011 domain-containing protein [Bacteroidales bacterium]
MKRVFISLIVLTGVFIFTDCKKPDPPEPVEPIVVDKTSPKITLPSTITLTIELGDEAEALKGVKATDDIDGDITKNIKILTNLDVVGDVELVYVVSDAAGNKDTARRDARISCNALSGEYRLKIYDVTQTPDTSQIGYGVTIARHGSDPLQLNVTNLHMNSLDFYFDPDPDNDYRMTLRPGKKGHDAWGTGDGDYKGYDFTGYLIYKKIAAGKYQVVSFSYELSATGKPTTKYETFSCVRE